MLAVEPSTSSYRAFIERKGQLDGQSGFAPSFMHPRLHDFQVSLVDWAVRQGRAAIFADCGLGKTPMQLTWAMNVVRETNKPVLVVAPLSVSMQTVDEAAKFDLPARRALHGDLRPGDEIVTTNYERLQHFDPDRFGGVVCDESSIIKSFDGVRRGQITEFMRRLPYRLLCTATAAPNDYVELGTSSEALGYLGHMDMLGRFFTSNEDSLHPAFIGASWRFKRHAERDFWRWLCSWARAVRKPSDLGFDDGAYVLPPLEEVEHVVPSPPLDGALFAMRAETLAEQREERRATIVARCERAAELLAGDEPAVAWGHLNAETDLLERLIPGAVQIAGGDADERKEEVIDAFRRGEILKLVTKPKIAAFGMNWQHCALMSFFPDHSFEQYYQATRRFWRFGQTRPVRVHNIVSESSVGVSANLRRKARACEEMFAQLIDLMNDALRLERFRSHDLPQEIPAWL